MLVAKQVFQSYIFILLLLQYYQPIYGFICQRETVDVLFMVKGTYEECRDQMRSLFGCFVDIEKGFDRVFIKPFDEVGVGKSGLPEVLERAVMSMCQGAKMKVKVGTWLSEKFLVL